MNWLIIAVNVVVFIGEAKMGADNLEQFLIAFGLIPERLVHAFSVGQVLTIFSSMFLHGGLAHLAGNMWFLHIFGDNVEDRMGHLGYLVFYLACGSAAALMQVCIAPDSPLPMIGASGAIAGVLGAYWKLFPRATVITFVPIFFIPQFIEVPAAVFLGLWFFMQFFSGFFALAGAAQEHAGMVAWWAHIGGFAVGFVLCGLFTARNKKAYREWYADEYFPW